MCRFAIAKRRRRFVVCNILSVPVGAGAGGERDRIRPGGPRFATAADRWGAATDRGLDAAPVQPATRRSRSQSKVPARCILYQRYEQAIYANVLLN
jgi:hypothetical protein